MGEAKMITLICTRAKSNVLQERLPFISTIIVQQKIGIKHD